MNERVNAFANLKDPPVFKPRRKAVTSIATEAVDRIAEQNNFLSRDPRQEGATPKRQPRTYRTGRNRHFAVKATTQTVERFHKAADERNVTLARLLELALDALENMKAVAD